MDDYDDDGYGPPTEADLLWYWSHVALAQDRPPARNRQGEPMEGQMNLTQIPLPSTLTRCNWCSQVIAKDAVIQVGSLVACTPLCARHLDQ